MSKEIKELVERLREGSVSTSYADKAADALEAMAGVPPAPAAEAANALEAMAGELEAYESVGVTWLTMMRAWINRAVTAEAERDRLKDEVERLKVEHKAELDLCDAELVSVNKQWSDMCKRAEAAEKERDRLKAALETIAKTIDGFEGRGDYVSYVNFSLDIADIARNAANHWEETYEA